MKKINLVLFVLILCVSLGASSLNLWAQESEIVAKVNGVEITKAQFYSTLEEQFGSYALSDLIVKELVNQKAETLQISLSEEEFASIYELIIQQMGGPQALQMFLLQNNATEAQFKEQLHWNMLLSELANSEVEVTEDALKEWFEQNRNFYDQPEIVEVSHILVDTEEEAQEIMALLTADGDFGAIAIEKSLDPGTANDGGYLGNITRGQTVPEFEETAFTLPIGEYGLAESNYGWHIILVLAKTEAELAVYSDVSSFVENDYKSERALDPESYLNKLEMEADIEIIFQPK